MPLMEKTKSIWEFLLSKGLNLTAEYIPTDLNTEADHESRNVQDWTEWKLCPTVFQQVCQQFGHPDMDLFASRVSYQIPNYMSLKLDPLCYAVDAMQQDWTHFYPYAFPPFSLIGKVLQKVRKQQIDMILIAPVWTTQPWYPILLNMAIEFPLFIQNKKGLLQDPQGNAHHLITNNTLHLSAWLISGKKWQVERFQAGLEHYWRSPEQQVPGLITTQPGRNFVAGVTNGKLIQFAAL